jgi:putative tricarboxylic transport membrane protein
MSNRTRISLFLGPDRIAALLFLAVVLLYGWGGSRLTAALQGDLIGPAFFPRILTVLGFVLAVLLFVRGAPRKAAEETDKGGSDITALVPAAMLLGYVLVLERLGFPLATILFLIMAFRYLGHPGWLGAVGYSVSITAVIFALFQYALDIKLPAGILAKFF